MHLDKSIFVRAPPAAVMRWLAPHRQPAWDRTLVRSASVLPWPEGPASAGERPEFVRVARAFGHRFESHAEADLDDRRFAWRQLDGDYEEHEGAFFLEPSEDGTRVHLVADVEFPYVMPLVVTEAEIRRRISAAADDALLRLKDLAEGARGGPSGAS